MEALTLVAKASSRHSLYKGVTLYKPTSKWRAQISHGGRTVTLGDYNTEEEAARVFDRACICKYGKDAVCNFPLEDYKAEFEELCGTTIPALLLKFKEERQRSKAVRALAASRAGSGGGDGLDDAEAPAAGTGAAVMAAPPPPLPLMPRYRTQSAGKVSTPKKQGGQRRSSPPLKPQATQHPQQELLQSGLTLMAAVPADAARASPRQMGSRERPPQDGLPSFAPGRPVEWPHPRRPPPHSSPQADAPRAPLQSPNAPHTHPPLRLPLPHHHLQHRRSLYSDDRDLDDAPMPGAYLAAAAALGEPAAAGHRYVQPRGLMRAATIGACGGGGGGGGGGCSPPVLLARTSSSPSLDRGLQLRRLASLPGPPAPSREWRAGEGAPAAEGGPLEMWGNPAGSHGGGQFRAGGWCRTAPRDSSPGDATDPEEARRQARSAFLAADAASDLAATEPAGLPPRRRAVSVVHAGLRRPPVGATDYRPGSRIAEDLPYEGEGPPYAMRHLYDARAVPMATARELQQQQPPSSPPLQTSRRVPAKRSAQQALTGAAADGAEPGSAAAAAITPDGGDGFDGAYLELSRYSAAGSPYGSPAAAKRPRTTAPLTAVRAEGRIADDAMEMDADIHAVVMAAAAAATMGDHGMRAAMNGSSSSGRGGGGTPESYNQTRRWQAPPAAIQRYDSAAAAAAAVGHAASSRTASQQHATAAWPPRNEQTAFAAAEQSLLPTSRHVVAAAAAELAGREHPSLDDLQQVLLAALLRREEQLQAQEQQQQQQQRQRQQQQQQLKRQQQQEVLAQLAEVFGLRSILADDALGLLEELVVAAAAAGAAGPRARTAGGSGGGAAGVEREDSGDAAPQQQQRQPKLRLSGGGMPLAHRKPNLATVAATAALPDSPTSSSSGGGGGTRDVRFLADPPAPAPTGRPHPLPAPLMRMPLPLHAYAGGMDASDGVWGLEVDTAAAAVARSTDGARTLKPPPTAASGQTASAATAGAGSGGGGAAAATAEGRPDQKWRVAAEAVYERAPAAPSLQLAIGRNVEMDFRGGGGNGGGSIEVPLVLRLPAQQLYGRLQLGSGPGPQAARQQGLLRSSQGGDGASAAAEARGGSGGGAAAKSCRIQVIGDCE